MDEKTTCALCGHYFGMDAHKESLHFVENHPIEAAAMLFGFMAAVESHPDPVVRLRAAAYMLQFKEASESADGNPRGPGDEPGSLS